MKFTSKIWSYIWLMYHFKRIDNWYCFQLRFERNSTIPTIFTKFKKFRLHNGKKISYIYLNKYKVGLRLGYFLITQYPTVLKKKKKKKF